MSKIVGAVLIEKEKCKGCSLCVVSCPKNTLDLSKIVNGKGYQFAEVKHPESCIGCASCALVCPESIITVYRKKFD